jgi:succinate dehydrogenase / fumarate reductase, cytochrome b subunit
MSVGAEKVESANLTLSPPSDPHLLGRKTMQRALLLFDTTVGKKAIMAVTGVILFGFVLGHMAGNLQIFAGAQKINDYSKFLHSLPSLLWGTRIVLLSSVVLHIAMALQLSGRNGQARQRSYQVKQDLVTNYAAKTMMLSGPTLAAFIAYHLAHLTVGVPMGSYQHSGENVYANLVHGFQVPWVAAIYIVANLLLGMHLFHGMWSFFQSLGLNHPRYNAQRRHFATAFAVLVTLGNVSIPVSVLAGIVKLDSRQYKLWNFKPILRQVHSKLAGIVIVLR